MIRKLLLLPCLLPYALSAQVPDSTGRDAALGEVVISGTMRPMYRHESPVPVEVYTASFLQKNPTPSLFDALAQVNGVQPQLTCNVCYTGGLQVNGLEGPYTLVLVDGMPIISALGSVYGLNGIPSELIQRIEVVKGPASTLYGSEAVGGLIHIITKDAAQLPRVSINTYRTGYQEQNTDVAVRLRAGRWAGLVSGNHFALYQRWDNNRDGFTDVPLQARSSVFTKWNLARPNNRRLSIAARYLYEDRFGGQTWYTRADRGTNRAYGESIYTHRLETFGTYQLPTTQDLTLNTSYVLHSQNSMYGLTAYNATQHVGFGQLVWDKRLTARQRLLSGAALRWTRYNDNTPATTTAETIWLPGLFVEHETTFNPQHTLLLGLRTDYDQRHGAIVSPRANWKWQLDDTRTLRLGVGNGFRVVNLFTEDHAALTGARQVVIEENLQPERSWNATLNGTQFVALGEKSFVTLDASLFHTYFSNRILPDYDSNPNEIRYRNLDGYSISQGVAINTNWAIGPAVRIIAGATYMDVFQRRRQADGSLQRIAQVHAPRFSGTFQASYTWAKPRLTFDWTGQVYGPMHLPVVPNDFRPAQSPWFTLQNVQATKAFRHNISLYCGIQNILDFVPSNPLLRPEDPFDKQANDPVNNPNGYQFDTAYNYAPLLGRRWFAGLRFHWD